MNNIHTETQYTLGRIFSTVHTQYFTVAVTKDRTPFNFDLLRKQQIDLIELVYKSTRLTR